MKRLSGTKIAERILRDLKKAIDPANPPTLAVVLVGEDAASRIYVRNKMRWAEKVGIRVQLHELQDTTAQDALLKLVTELNTAKEVDGILVQMPLPEHISANAIIAAIAPNKDADGFHPFNRKGFRERKRTVFPVLAQAVSEFMDESGIRASGKNAVVIARNGSPMQEEIQDLLERHGMHVALHTDVHNAANDTKQSDVIVIGVGGQQSKHMLTGEHIKNGALVIDIGIIRDPNNPKKLSGNVDPASTRNKDGFLTPVPGGVGPLTIAFLLKNVYELHEQRKTA